ncbi:hypothetical protein [Bradyrhizobium sp. USDA 10063]
MSFENEVAPATGSTLITLTRDEKPARDDPKLHIGVNACGKGHVRYPSSTGAIEFDRFTTIQDKYAEFLVVLIERLYESK